MSNSESSITTPGANRGGDHSGGRPEQQQAVFHVGNRQGRIEPHGEVLTGSEILSRVGLSAEKYELWTVEQGRTGEQVQPTDTQHVKPGDHFRATIRGTDYSFPARRLG